MYFSELPDIVVKGVSRVSVQVVVNYTDGASRNHLRELIYTLARKHPAAPPAIALSLYALAQNYATAPHSS